MDRKEAVTILQEKRDLARKLEAAEKSADWAAKDRVDSSSLRASQHGRYADALDMAISALSPSNEPLTLEELREMDGEPVWVVYDQDAAKTTPGFDPLTLWALVEVTKDSVFLTNNLGGRTAYADNQDLAWAGITAYRRPPEGAEDGNV